MGFFCEIPPGFHLLLECSLNRAEGTLREMKWIWLNIEWSHTMSNHFKTRSLLNVRLHLCVNLLAWKCCHLEALQKGCWLKRFPNGLYIHTLDWMRAERHGDEIRWKGHVTHVNVLQLQHVEGMVVASPDDWRPLVTCDGTREHGALTHCYRGDAQLLVFRKGELIDLWETMKRELVNIKVFPQ